MKKLIIYFFLYVYYTTVFMLETELGNDLVTDLVIISSQTVCDTLSEKNTPYFFTLKFSYFNILFL